MRFGIHNSSWLDGPDPAEAFEAVKAKAQWAEDHGFVWFSVLDHMIQIPRVEPVQKPRPPVMIAGGGEQMTLRAVARLADASRTDGRSPRPCARPSSRRPTAARPKGCDLALLGPVPLVALQNLGEFERDERGTRTG